MKFVLIKDRFLFDQKTTDVKFTKQLILQATEHSLLRVTHTIFPNFKKQLIQEKNYRKK